MAMTTVAAVSQNNTPGNGAPRAGRGQGMGGNRGPGMGGPGMGQPGGGRRPGVGGEVTSVDAKAGTIAVASRWDETLTVKLATGAKILARKDATIGDLKIGDTIQVSGVFSQLTAAAIQSGELPDMPPPMGGGRPGFGGPGMGGPGEPGGQGGQRGFGGQGGRRAQRGPGGQGWQQGPVGQENRRGPGGPDDFGGGPGFPGGPGGPDEMGGPGEDGPPPPDAMQGASSTEKGASHARDRRGVDNTRSISADGPGRGARPADLEQDSESGPQDDFDVAQGPPPPRFGGRGGDDRMDDGPMAGPGGPRGEGPMGGGLRGEGPMGGGLRGDGPMGGGPRGGGMMGGGGPRGGMMGGGAHLSGKITSVSPLTIAINDRVSLTIKTDAKTRVTKIVSESLGDIKKGDRIFAMGTFSKDVLTAKSVSVNLEP
ncbi:MAG: hypothetical protein ABIY70_08235 [Capsulimonas sp.]